VEPDDLAVVVQHQDAAVARPGVWRDEQEAGRGVLRGLHDLDGDRVQVRPGEELLHAPRGGRRRRGRPGELRDVAEQDGAREASRRAAHELAASPAALARRLITRPDPTHDADYVVPRSTPGVTAAVTRTVTLRASCT
jgi:hypothetical protein